MKINFNFNYKGKVSLERIQDFLLLDEMNEVKITHNDENGIFLVIVVKNNLKLGDCSFSSNYFFALRLQENDLELTWL
jgi:hypothetical protein